MKLTTQHVCKEINLNILLFCRNISTTHQGNIFLQYSLKVCVQEFVFASVISVIFERINNCIWPLTSLELPNVLQKN